MSHEHCHIIFTFSAFLLFSTVHIITSQSCKGCLSNKGMESSPQQKDSFTKPEIFSRDPNDVAEELDFFPPEKIDLTSYLGKNISQALSPVEFVRNFTRSVKLGTSLLVSGSGKKPAWCFYPYALKKLARVELDIYRILKKYYDADRSNQLSIPILSSYLRDIEESSLKAKRNVETSKPEQDPYLYIASHPILIYRLIRRFAEDLQPILKVLDSLNKGIILELSKFANPDLLVFPTKADLDDALEVIGRTQHGNTLDTYKMARGILGTIDTGIHLNAFHCLEIGAFYLNRKDFDYAIQWNHVALVKARKSELVKRVPEIREFFNRTLERAIEEHNANFRSQFGHRWGPGVFNSLVRIPFVRSSYVRRIEQLDPEASRQRHVKQWNWAIMSNFRRVCSGENLQSEEEKALLKCWYNRKSNPYWVINPLKTELLSRDPPVYQIYEFLGEKLMTQMKNIAVDNLTRSTVKVADKDDADVHSKVDSTRTSSQTWLHENDDIPAKFLVSLSEKLEMMSGLVIVPDSASDAYQVAAYGPSHHYEAHLDAFDSNDHFQYTYAKGNRITTIMGYLNDVELGGKTGFPVLGMAADPIKGSIVIWDNIKKNGKNLDE